jgi:hypothetical protein
VLHDNKFSLCDSNLATDYKPRRAEMNERTNRFSGCRGCDDRGILVTSQNAAACRCLWARLELNAVQLGMALSAHASFRRAVLALELTVC